MFQIIFILWSVVLPVGSDKNFTQSSKNGTDKLKIVYDEYLRNKSNLQSK